MTEMLTEGRFRAGLDVYEAQSVWLFGRVPRWKEIAEMLFRTIRTCTLMKSS